IRIELPRGAYVPAFTGNSVNHPTPPKSDRRAPRWIVAAALAGILLVAAVLLALARVHPQGSLIAIAVLPFENLTPDPADEYFAAGLTDVLVTRLSQVKALRVVPLTSARRSQK